ncbi:MAG: glycosyltransferase [Leuconostoc gelidum]|jgi:glycosyltransferase involved in cell wall biosynthesis|uniref:glycosyltransferase family 2 protein n=1 Tax=Leuconostoc gelidum TaxID=1244 RepID=UPI002F357F30
MMISKPVPQLSIIIPVYNTGEYLENSFNSIVKADEFNKDNVEIIFINDHSDEQTRQILNKFDFFDYVHVFNLKDNDPHGAGNARNMGMSIASGKYYYFMDADDKIKRNFFSIVFAQLNNTNYDVLTFGFEMVDSETGELLAKKIANLDNIIIRNENWEQNIFWYFDNVNVFSVWNKIYDASFLKRNHLKFPNSRTAQDALFNLKMLSCVTTIKVIKENLYMYLVGRPGSNQTISKSKFENEFDVIMELKLLFKNFSNLNWQFIVYNQILEVLTREYKYALSVNHNSVSKNLSNGENFYLLSKELNNYYKKNIIKIKIKNQLRSIFFKNSMRINIMGWLDRHV